MAKLKIKSSRCAILKLEELWSLPFIDSIAKLSKNKKIKINKLKNKGVKKKQ